MPVSFANADKLKHSVKEMHLKHQVLTFVFLVVLVFILLTLARQQGILEFAELIAYDQFVSSSTSTSRHAAPIVLIEITEQDIQALGRWPLTDAILADLLNRLLFLDPSVIGVDIYRDFAIPPGSSEFREVLENNTNVYFVEKFSAGNEIGVSPPEALKDTEQFGFSDLVLDPSGVVRRNLLLQGNGQRISYSFSLRMALHYLQREGIFLRPSEQNPDHMKLGEVTLVPLSPNDGGYSDADTSGYQILMDYNGGFRPFPRFTLDDIYMKRLSADLIRNKIVIVGVSSESVKDSFIIPHSFWQEKSISVSGVTIHAHALNQLLNAAFSGRRPLAVWTEKGELVWILLWTLLGGAAGYLSYAAIRFAVISVFGVVVLIGIANQMFVSGVWIPLVPAVFGWLLALVLVAAFRANIQRKERNDLMMLLSKQVSPEVAREIWSRRDEILEAGRIRPKLMTSTVMFTDMQGFTQISDRLPPKEFMDWLNSYMLTMSELIMRFGGVVDDYAGDGIKANFGIPFERLTESEFSDDAKNAVDCALAMVEALNGLNRRWLDHGLPNVGVRIGIHSGPVVVGTLGSADRMKFTTVGRTVNLASRLESTKEIQQDLVLSGSSLCRILLSESTAKYLPNSYQLVSVGDIELKGLSEKIRAFQVQYRPKVESDPQEQGDTNA